ncbi:MAG TPA: hypothetical protein VI912_00565 [Candidatus Bilamarchaeaceae archaeon]|nr:hypothetical protein [Candidatus Bilamarchaeaceae archaeon]
MRKVIVLLCIILLSSLSFAQGNLTTVVTDASSSPLEFANSWVQISILIIIFMVIIVSIAYMFGKGFELPGLLAFSRVELVQVFANEIIILLTMSVISTADFFVRGAIEEGVGIVCTPDEYCIGRVSSAYIDDTVDLIYGEMGSNLDKAIEKGASSAKGFGANCQKFFDPFWFPCYVYMGYSGSYNKEESLHVERYGAEMDYYNSFLGSLFAQRFFVSHIIPAFAPFVLFLGIILRTFFATRKVGGLLIAMAIGALFVFPMMFVFDWMSLNVAVYGDAAAGSSDSACPLYCTKVQPIAYRYSDNLIVNSSIELRHILNGEAYSNPQTFSGDDLETNLNGLLNGTLHEAAGIISCSSPQFAECPQECRRLPMPSSQSCWGNRTSEIACGDYPVQCKFIQAIDPPSIDPDKVAMCTKDGEDQDEFASSFCKTILPMKNDCNVGLVQYTDGVHLASMASNSCSLPQSCFRCSLDDDGDPVCPSSCFQTLQDCGFTPLVTQAEIQGSCINAKPSCRVVFRESFNANPNARGTGITDCTLNFVDPLGPWPLSRLVDAQACPASLDPYKSCVYILPKDGSLCKDCLFTEEDYQYSPPVLRTCEELCGPASGGAKMSVADFAKNSGGGYIGREDIKSVSKFAIPAYILPLLNIVVTVMFIKTFSTMLGGDVEIPGLSKVF